MWFGYGIFYFSCTTGRGVNSTSVSRGGQRTILLQHPQNGNHRIDGYNSDVEHLQHVNVRQRNPKRQSFSLSDTYHQHLDISQQSLISDQPLSRQV